MNYLQVRDVVQSLPIYGQTAEIETAIEKATRTLGGAVVITAQVGKDNWVKYTLSNTDSAKAQDIETLRRLAADGRFKESQFFKVFINIARGIKYICYGVDAPKRVIR